ncbi:MAG: hypothetical protein CFE45_08940 [Burkholderiales bacterium PBB5]|nr:MAG: hypothetical protein CFE45_08940 [Burkholderiales bacterium PBB5]
MGAFDSPKHAGLPLGEVLATGSEHLDLQLADPTAQLHNGDGITWWDLQGELHGVPLHTARPLDGPPGRGRASPNEPVAQLKDLKRGVAVFRNRDMAWDRALARKSSARRIAVDLRLDELPDGLLLSVTDEGGTSAQAELRLALQPAQDPARAQAALHDGLTKLGNTIFEARSVDIATAQPWFVPAGALNGLRRDGIKALEAARQAQRPRLPRAAPVQPPVPYPDDTLSYLANVYNQAAHDFYAAHGVKLIGSAYESHEVLGEASLMITKHCVRYSLSLCPKQAKGVTGVQGTIRAEPLTLQHGNDTLTLRFDCKPCEMHVVGKLRKNVLREAAAQPLTFYRQRPLPAAR